MAPPWPPTPKPTAAKSASADTESPAGAVSDSTAGGVSPNGLSAHGKGSPANGGPAAVDDTIVDGVPALPADTIGSAPGADPAPSGTKPSGPGSSGLGSPGSAPSRAVPPGRSSPAESSPVSPAAFAWEVPDQPTDSPSSPARNFLRSALTITGAVAKSGSSGGTDTGQTAADEGPAAARGSAQKAPVPPAPAPQAPAQQVPAQKAPYQKAPSQKAKSKRTARQAHLTIARVEPWSVMKFSFVVSLVAFVILFVAVSVLYGVLSAVGVFDSLQRVVTSLTSSQGSAGVNARAWFSASRVLGYTALLGSLNIVLITAISTIGAVVYNLTSRLVGGVEVTLRETE
jgi:hypothetical protein